MSTQETVDKVVRRFGSDKTHVVTIQPDIIQPYSVFRTEFKGIPGPLTARCTTRVCTKSQVAVIMRPGTQVLCRACRIITGIDYATNDQWGEGEHLT